MYIDTWLCICMFKYLFFSIYLVSFSLSICLYYVHIHFSTHSPRSSFVYFANYSFHFQISILLFNSALLLIERIY